MEKDLQLHGFTAVPRDAQTFLKLYKKSKNESTPIDVKDLPIPTSELAKAVQQYAQKHLRTETYHHSLRVYHYGQAMIKQHFPDLESLSTETWFITAMLHDIGTTSENLHATLLSFEFYGGFLALDLLRDMSAPKTLAEAVCEAIIRHQDLGSVGKLTSLGQLIQLATIFDNAGQFQELIHSHTVENVVEEYPRLEWSKCFAGTIKEENALKPWSHTTALGEEEFPKMVMDNQYSAVGERK